MLGWEVHLLKVNELSSLVEEFCHGGNRTFIDVVGESGLVLKALGYGEELHVI